MKKPKGWSQRFWKPVYPRDGEPMETLADARAYIVAMPHGAGTRGEWKQAIEAVMGAAEGKVTTHVARDKLTAALFLNAKLDLEHE